MSEPKGPDYDSWLSSWDLQQNAHIRNREARFKFMLEMVGNVCGKSPVILDLACGPGSLSGRFLKEFPQGKSIAVDYDPVLLRIAGNSSRYDHSRVTFIEADLASENWVGKLPERNFDAIMSTTALHWLSEGALSTLYSSIHGILNQGGIFLNGDHIYPASEPQRIKDIFTEARHEFENGKFSTGEALNWSDWWNELSKNEELIDLFEERSRRYPDSDNHSKNISLEKHMEFLKDAGFTDIAVGWQDLDNRVLMALK